MMLGTPGAPQAPTSNRQAGGEPAAHRAFQRGRSIMFGGMSDHTKVPIRDLQPDGTLSEQRLLDSAEFILAVRARLPAEELRQRQVQAGSGFSQRLMRPALWHVEQITRAQEEVLKVRPAGS